MISLLVPLVSIPNDLIVAESIITIRKILQQGAEAKTLVLLNLLKSLDEIKISKARASVLWLVGEYCNEGILDAIPDALRISVKTFRDYDSQVKLQTLNFAAKMICFFLSLEQSRDFQKCLALFRYLLQLASLDLNFDVRDRARALKSLVFERAVVGDSDNLKFLKDILNVSKTVSFASPNPRDGFEIGSISHYSGIIVKEDNLPAWSLVSTDPSLRMDDVVEKPVIEVKHVRPADMKKRVIDLNDFYANKSEVIESSSEEDEKEGDD